MVETGRAVAFVMDDILLYSLVANSKTPSEWVISADALSVEPYGIMLRKDDPSFKKVVDEAMTKVYKSGEINKIYAKWFLAAGTAEGHQPQRADERGLQARGGQAHGLRRPERLQVARHRVRAAPVRPGS